MLCFLFAALVVLLDQLFKHWVVIAIPLHEEMELIPGILRLTHVENTGAAFSILANQRWLLAGIAFVAAFILIMILLRYNEGFWGTLGLAAVLGGAVGNLIDRVFYGHVIDMFEPVFVNFAIFNIADIFITLGGITFCVFFIVVSFRPKRSAVTSGESGDTDDYDEEPYEAEDYDDESDDDFDSLSDTRVVPSGRHASAPRAPAREERRMYDDAESEPEDMYEHDPGSPAGADPDDRRQDDYNYSYAPPQNYDPQEDDDSEYLPQEDYNARWAPQENYEPKWAPQDDYEPGRTPQVEYEPEYRPPEYGPAEWAPPEYGATTPETPEYGDSAREAPAEPSSTLDALSMLESELNAFDDYDVDALLREYGFEDDKN